MKKKAFTMAEAVLVMTILGIIATIMITTLKPAEFKEKGLAVLAKKVLGEIDTATTQILLNNTQSGLLSAVYVPNAASTFNTGKGTTASYAHNLGILYKKYLTATRKACTSTTDCGSCASGTNKFFLKDGACIGISTGSITNLVTRFPGETADTTVNPSPYGAIYFDINGAEEPNLMGKDQFTMPLGLDGILYQN